MKPDNSNDLIVHIDEAKEWLDKAKTEYIASNLIRGELNLNLAQAEVKYAWELSHNQNVSGSKKVDFVRKNKHRNNRYAVSTAAAAAVIIVGLFFYNGYQNRSGVNNSQKIGKNNIESKPAVTEISVLPNDKGEASKSDLDLMKPDIKPLVKPVVSPQETSEREQVVEKQKTTPKDSLIEKTDTNRSIVSVASTKNKIVAIERAIKKEKKEVATVKETSDSIEQDNSLLGFKPQPVSVNQLFIDEEALTREASRSLRNGK